MINRENYEAYYLDYLENNLDIELRKDFEEFLLENEDLRLDEISINSIEVDDSPGINKTLLYQTDLENDLVNSKNFNDFALADLDDLISENKKKELNHFANKKNLDLNKFKQLHLSVDYSLKYKNKADLKKRDSLKRIYFISTISAAASALIFVLLTFNPSESTLELKSTFKASKSDTYQNQFVPYDKLDTSLIDSKSSGLVAKIAPLAPTNFQNDPIEKISMNNLKAISKDLVAYQKDTVFKYRMLMEKPIEQEQNIYLSSNEMKNPIKPITNKLSDVINQEVDFKNSKSDQNNSKGFFIKIGKFEIYHKK